MESRIRNEPSARNAMASSVAPAMGGAGPSAMGLVRELDHRFNDHIDVWLRWRTSDDLLFVEVADGRTGERFVVEVADGERPLDVFRHPYAYAGDSRSDPHAAVES